MKVRMCVACRERDNKEKLIRFILQNGELKEDVEKKLPGRGAHLHEKHSCIMKIPSKDRLENVLRGSIDEESWRTFRAGLMMRIVKSLEN